MKRKHSGLLTFILIFLTLSITVLYATQDHGKEIDTIRISSGVKSLPVVSVPASSLVKDIENLEKIMTDLPRPQRPDLSPVNLTLFGYQPMGKLRVASRGKQTVLSTRMDYNLSLAFTSGKKRFCVIDGTFYTEGGHLPDGAIIIKIEPNRALIGKRQIKEWISIAEGIQPARKKKEQNK